jgi:hypothetical protein
MPFVKRNIQGEIEAVSQYKDASFDEEIDPNDKQLQLFLSSIGKSNAALVESDMDFVRVVEDLVELLIAKNYIRFTDLPDKAQEKMRSRQTLRGTLNSRLDLLSDDYSDDLL